MKILIVDDDAYFTEYLAELFEEKTYESIIANDVDAAFSEYERNKNSISFIVLDLMMRAGTNIQPILGYENGEALFKKIRLENKNIPIVVVTAKNRSEIKISQDNNTEIIIKPILSEEEILNAYNRIK